MIRANSSGYVHGTSGSPQCILEQNEYAARVAENEAKLKAKADNAPLIDPLHIAEIEAKEARFTRGNVMFTARDVTGQVVWLEKGTKTAGFNHLKARGHITQLARMSFTIFSRYFLGLARISSSAVPVACSNQSSCSLVGTQHASSGEMSFGSIMSFISSSTGIASFVRTFVAMPAHTPCRVY